MINMDVLKPYFFYWNDQDPDQRKLICQSIIGQFHIMDMPEHREFIKCQEVFKGMEARFALTL